MPFRALIKTHHMTSRRKIRALSSAAKTHACTVVLKTGRPPGVMIAESDSHDDLQEWVDVVKSLRYKFYDLLYIGESENGKLVHDQGHVKEVGEMKALGRYLEECGMLGWWGENMKFLVMGWGGGVRK